MYALDNKSGIKQMPEIPEVFSKEPLWFTEGRDGNAPSYPGAHWFNIIQAELLNVLKEAGIEPNKTDLTQLAKALQVLSGQVESIDALREFEPTREGQRVVVKMPQSQFGFGYAVYYYDAIDNKSADNNGTTIVTNNGKRWKHIERTGGGNVILGAESGGSAITQVSDHNNLVVIGRKAAANLTNAYESIAIGSRALGTTRVTRDNIAIGADSLYNVNADTPWYSQSQVNGSRNIGIGGNAGRGITSGYSNIAIGRNAGQNLESGSLNVALGAGAIGGIVPVGFSGDIEHAHPSKIKESVAVGVNALNQYIASSSSVAVGAYAAEKLKKGLYNTAIGFGSLKELEADIAPNGGSILWQGNQQGTYSQNGNVITLTFDNLQGADVNCIVGVRLLDGAAKTLLNDVVPAKVLSKTDNTITIQSSKSLNTSGQAELRYVYSNTDVGVLDTNHNTAVGFATLYKATRSGFAVAIGAHALKLGQTITRTVAVGASAFERGNHTKSIGIGSHAANTANTNNAIVIGVSAMANASDVNNSIIIGNDIGATGSVNNKLAIGSGFTGDLQNNRYGVNIPVTQNPLANLHVRPKGSRGSGRTQSVDGLLVEHSGVAVTTIDGGSGADLDFVKGDELKFSIRYRADSDITTIMVNNEHSWKFSGSHELFPDKDNVNAIGRPSRRLKSVYVTSPDKQENGDKAITAKWFRGQFSQNLVANNGWRILPNGEIEQWGFLDFPERTSQATIHFPIAFNECFFVIPIDISNSASVVGLSVGNVNNTSATINSTKYAGGIKWYAKGR